MGFILILLDFYYRYTYNKTCWIANNGKAHRSGLYWRKKMKRSLQILILVIFMLLSINNAY